MRTKSRTGVNVGGSSILVIFVLLCLTTFATLSMVSANADYNLTKKAADAAVAYYEADAQAEELLQQVDKALQNAAVAAGDASSYYSMVSDQLSDLGIDGVSREGDFVLIDYQVEMSDTQALQVLLEARYSASQRFERKVWQVVTTAPWEMDGDGMDIWDGNLDEMLAIWEGE